MSEAFVSDVARHLGKEVTAKSCEQFAAAQRLVALARRYGGDAGTACLAGVWLGQGMPEHEIVARLWPQHRARLQVVA